MVDGIITTEVLHLWDDPARNLHMFPPHLDADSKLFVFFNHNGVRCDYTLPFNKGEEALAYIKAALDMQAYEERNP